MYGNRLRSLRKEKRWTIEEVAEKLNIPKSTYAGYETEKRKPPISKIEKMADLFDVSSDYILGLTDEKEPKKVENNAYEYLKKNNLHWNGVPLSEEELKPIRDLLEIIVRDRLPKYKDKL